MSGKDRVFVLCSAAYLIGSICWFLTAVSSLRAHLDTASVEALNVAAALSFTLGSLGFVIIPYCPEKAISHGPLPMSEQQGSSCGR